MIALVITGGQTGADQSGWRAAKAAGISCGGWMPKGFMTEDGPRPEFAELYGASETKSSSYPARTRMNVFGSDGTLIFDTVNAKKLKDLSRGSQLTIRAAMEYGRPNLTSVVVFGKPIEPKRPACIVDWIAEHGIRVLNIAGNRESRSPGIGAWVERYLTEVFRLLREAGEPGDRSEPIASVAPFPSASPAAPPHPEDR
jgi:hypothetical protein